MKNMLIAGVLLLATATLSATPTNVELADIVSGKYNQQGVPAQYDMQDGEHYLQLDGNHTMIIKYSYRTGEVVDTIFDVKKARECPFDRFDGYTLSPDDAKILIYTDSESIYRHSFKANYYTFEIKRNLVKPLTDEEGKQQVATFSPNSRMVAFVRNNNIYLKKLDYDTESAITKDGCKDSIINGIPDWVYEEEFARVKSLAWSGDSERLAFIKYDEREVPMYTMQLFEGSNPTRSEYAQYPGEFTYKYPVAGAKNAKVSVHVYTVSTRGSRELNIPLDADGYIPDIRFTQDPELLAVMTMNRHQNKFSVYSTNTKSGVSRLLVQDENERWIEQSVIDYLTFYPDFFVFASERSGYMHLYKYSNTGVLQRAITSGDWDVTAYLGYDEHNNTFYYQSAEEGPLYRSVYRVNAKGKKEKISQYKGTNTARFNPTCSYYINRYSSANLPVKITVHDKNNRLLRVLQDNSPLNQELANTSVAKKEFMTFKNEVGQDLNGWIMKPIDFDPTKKYPVLMLQYSGPGSQEVKDEWEYGWEQYLAANGYVVACADGRGTGARGEEFSKCIYLQMGNYEADDQIAFAQYLGSLPYIQKENIAIWGWSFGGYNTLMSMSKSKGVFKAGVAIAPVTDWRYYDTIYAERYMRTPKENIEGYDKTSPLKMANQLNGRLLLISGTFDDNVHPQNSLQYNEALVQANIQFDSQYYTNRNHSIFGGNTRLHLYTKVFDFLELHLK